MKTILSLLLLTAIAAFAADPAPAETDPYAAGQFSVSPFVGVNAKKFNPVDGKGEGGFTGVAVAYSVTKAISITAEGAARDTNERFVDQFGAHGKGYLPLSKSGLALYGEIGWQQFTGDERRNFLSTGGGVEVRGKRVGAFAGVRWLQDFADTSFAQYVIGGSLRF